MAGGAPAESPRGAVLFDFGGTLDSDGLRWSVRFHAAYSAAGGRLDLAAFEPVFRRSDRALEARRDIRTLGFRAMVEAQSEILRTLLPDGEQVDAAAVAVRVHSDAVVVAARNRAMLDGLRRQFRLAVVSNFTGNLDVCLAELRMHDAFDIVTDSAIFGALKPDPTLFTRTLAHLGVPPQRAWMVGDNFDADIRPAHRLGMRTVWLTDAHRPLPPGCVPTARITSLADLARVLLSAPQLAGGAAPCTV